MRDRWHTRFSLILSPLDGGAANGQQRNIASDQQFGALGHYFQVRKLLRYMELMASTLEGSYQRIGSCRGQDAAKGGPEVWIELR